MNNSKMITGAAALVALIAVAGIAGASFAYQGNPDIKGPEYFSERHDAIEKAMEEGDYEAWRELMNNRGKISQVVNEENFDKFVQFHDLAEEGKFKEARSIGEDLGLGRGLKKGSIYKNRHMIDNRRGGEMRDVFENGDYETWKELMENKLFGLKDLEKSLENLDLTEDNFNKLVEAHNLMKVGDSEGAQKIKEELGLNQGFGRMGMLGKGLGCDSCPLNPNN